MRRAGKAAVGVLGLLVLLGALVCWRTLRRGLSTRDEPAAAEVLVARAMRRWATPAALRDAKNPLPSTPAVLAEARAHWADHCALCHGNDGEGRTAIGQGLYPRAPDMTLAVTQELSDGELYGIIENGVRLTGMPGWGDGSAESVEESWGLVHLVRRLPELTAEELAAMEALNPRSPEEWEELRAEQEFLAGGSAPAPAAGHGATPHGH